ncbi:hypothetical protein [Gymnodinialimonas sp.]
MKIGAFLMDDTKDPELLDWTDPELIDLDKSMEDVHAIMGPTTDGFMGSES